MEEDLVKLSDELHQEAQSIPNMTHPDVPIGGEDSSSVRKLVMVTESHMLFTFALFALSFYGGLIKLL